MIEGRPLDELHHEDCLTIDLVQPMDPHHVGVLHVANHLGLACEPLRGARVEVSGGVKDLAGEGLAVIGIDPNHRRDRAGADFFAQPKPGSHPG